MIGIVNSIIRNNFKTQFDKYITRLPLFSFSEISQKINYNSTYSKLTNFATPSLLFIPNARKFDTIFSAIGSNLTFSGLGDKSRINSNGNVEFTRRNLFSQSEDLPNWIVANQFSLTASNVTTAPDGALTGDKFIADNTLNQHRLGQFATLPLNTYVFSVFAKAAEYSFLSLGTGGGVGGGDVIFNLANGTIGGTNVNNANPIITPYTNGWYRCSITTTNSGSLGFWLVVRDSNSTANFIGNNTSGVFIWGAQLEIGSTPTTYQKTTTSNLTARIDYSSGSSALLLEPARTNLLLNSNNLSAATYTLTETTLSGNIITENTNSGIHSLNTTFQTGFATNTLHTFSVLLKQNNGTRNVRISISNGADGDIFSQVLNLANGTLSEIILSNGSWSNISNKVTTLPNGYYLFEISGQSSNGTSRRFSVQMMNGSNGNYIGNGSSSIEVQHIQGEIGSFATSRILTTTTTVTRTADKYNVTIPTTSNGTCVINVIDNIPQLGGGTHLYGCLSLIGTNGIYLSKTNGGRLRLWTAASSTIYSTTITNLKLAITFDGTNINVWENGVKVVTNFAYALSNVNLIESSNSIETVNSIKTLAFYNSILSNSQCISLTT